LHTHQAHGSRWDAYVEQRFELYSADRLKRLAEHNESGVGANATTTTCTHAATPELGSNMLDCQSSELKAAPAATHVMLSPWAERSPK
jgi:hypothetical protein